MIFRSVCLQKLQYGHRHTVHLGLIKHGEAFVSVTRLEKKGLALKVGRIKEAASADDDAPAFPLTTLLLIDIIRLFIAGTNFYL